MAAKKHANIYPQTILSTRISKDSDGDTEAVISVMTSGGPLYLVLADEAVAAELLDAIGRAIPFFKAGAFPEGVRSMTLSHTK